MSKILSLGITILIYFESFSQVYCDNLLSYDNMENYTWFGDWWAYPPTVGFFSNASVSPSFSAVIYGTGSGSSSIESDWYSLPNVSGLNPVYDHAIRFRLASYRFSSTASSRGVDSGDFIEVQLSTDGGFNYTSEIRVRGFGNAYWDYNTNASISKVADGSLVTYQPTGGGNRTLTGDGYSVIELIVPAGTTDIALDIYCRLNANGEEWWIDNIELIELLPCTPLPIELLNFYADWTGSHTLLRWETASEHNNSHFEIERSLDGLNWERVQTVQGAGNSTQKIEYSSKDLYSDPGIVYYKLKQIDFDGQWESFGPISVSIPGSDVKEAEYFNIEGKKIEWNEYTPHGIYLKKEGDKITKVMK